MDEAHAAFMEQELETLYRASEVLSYSLRIEDTLSQVLGVIGGIGIARSMVTLLDPATGSLLLTSIHGGTVDDQEVRYAPGEGIIGGVLASGSPVALTRLGEESNFLDRLGLFDVDGPFIGAPIRVDRSVVGVLAVQPSERAFLSERARLVAMIANLIARSVALALKVKGVQRNLTEERDRLQRTLRENFGFEQIVGHTPPMRHLFEQVRLVAKWDTTVLIRGESGTGKELIANAIHYNSSRREYPFVKLNCAVLADSLLESELFGHEKGAFTGAVSQRKGRFEQASGGTLFLDEIGEISASFQAKLLRVIQEGEFERVGGTRTITVDVRVLTATHRDLERNVDEGRFREDLYYRLNVMPIFVPALRERMADLPELAHSLLTRLAAKQQRTLRITDSAIRVLMHHDWPGNVRELENCLERAAIMSETGVLDSDVVQPAGRSFAAPARVDDHPPGNGAPARPQPHTTVPIDQDDERERVVAALEQVGWVQAKAARLLGMTPRQIAYRIQTYNIKMRKI